MNKKTGMYWHVHHDRLVEWCYDYDWRVQFIKTRKHVDEIETRLRLFQPVRGKLPVGVEDAFEVLKEAKKKVHQAWKVYDNSNSWINWTRDEMRRARMMKDEAETAANEAWKDLDEMIQQYMIEIEALHEKECPDCPWNGEEIVF